MGGGDLNLKKSWHPLTMKNLERVWKAEQRHSAEQKRIQELQSEIKEERARQEVQQMAIDAGVMKARDDRVDWLYKGPGTINREEYLLGKPIDKAIDPTLIEEEREKEALASGPGALFVPSSSSSVAAGSVTADLEVKIREDPLFMIKKNEEEAKKRLLDNPIKLQQLQKIIMKSKSKKKHKHKSEKKSKKARHRHNDSASDSESDSDTTAHQKYSKRDNRDSNSPTDRRRERRNRHRHHSPDRSRSLRRDRHRERSPIRRSRSRSPQVPRHRGSSARSYERPSREQGSGNNVRGSGASSITRKMDPQELERRRQEMMSSAKQRDEERETRVAKHKEELEKEEAEVKGRKEDFLKPMRVQSLTSSANLEDRIHRNINSVQRTKAALNDNFLKR